MYQIFKPGDRVQLKSGGPVMEVIKYTDFQLPLIGKGVSNSKVLCVWYDKRLGRQTGTFHQRSLFKSKLPVNTFLKTDNLLSTTPFIQGT